MQELSAKILKSVRENLVEVFLGLFLIIDIFSLSAITYRGSDALLNISGQSASSVNTERAVQPLVSKSIPKISEIKDPRIDDEAAMIVVEEALSAQAQAKVCFSLPVEIWVFLLIAFLALLIFNLTYHFGQAMKIQWGWELALTILPLVAWYALDECRTFVWFPLHIIEMGVIIYALYLYFFEKKFAGEKEQTESLFERS